MTEQTAPTTTETVSPHSSVPTISGAAVPEQLIKPLALRAMFMAPAYLEQSAWLEHIPFAFWLIEAHKPRVFVELGAHHGASYFAFCQAVERLGLDTRCFAIDTWKGDQHAGFYGEEVFGKVNAYNDAQYSRFSRLVRSPFDEALGHFSDGTIDLLHIDGEHTLEAVRRDFESWLPKLSERAVVVMHDSNVRERRFGVFGLVEKLRESYPAFEFIHGHGLTVLGVGAEQNDELKHLFKLQDDSFARPAIHEIFTRLGRACADAFAAKEQKGRIANLESSIGKQKRDIDNFSGALEKTKQDLHDRNKQLNEAREKIHLQLEQHATQRGQLAERVTLLGEIREELKDDVRRLNDRMDQTTVELKARTDTLLELQQASQEHHRLLTESRNQTNHYKQSLETTRAELEDQKKALQAELEIQKQAVISAQEAIEEQRITLAAWEKGYRKQRKIADKATKEYERKLAQQSEKLQETEQERDRFKAEAETLNGKLKTRFDEIATLTKLFDAAEKASDTHKAEIEALKKQKQSAETTAVALEQKLDLTAKENKKQADQQAARLREAEQARDKHKAELDNTARKLDDRIQELVRFTRILQEKDDEVDRLEAARQATVKQLGKAVMALLGYSPGQPLSKRRRNRLVARIEKAGIVDGPWYLGKYPDVAEAGMNPAVHYLMHGADEGREPGDAFQVARGEGA